VVGQYSVVHDMRRHAITTQQRLASWISSADIIPSTTGTIQSSYAGGSSNTVSSPSRDFLRRFAVAQQEKTGTGSQKPPSLPPPPEEPPPPPPGMFAVVSSMIAGAGGAVLVAGIGYVYLVCLLRVCFQELGRIYTNMQVSCSLSDGSVSFRACR